MKTLLKLIGSVVALAVVAAVVYRVVNRAPSQSLPQTEQAYNIFEQAGCLMCHSATPKLPFYASWPLADKMIGKDVSSGYRMFDIEPTMNYMAQNKIVGEVACAKIEQSVMDGLMPPARYYLVHWGSQITSAKREAVLEWARLNRRAYYAQWQEQSGVADEFADEPVQPLPSAYPHDKSKVELGRALYHDVRLSADNTVSCATCHDLSTAGVDNKRVSTGIEQQQGTVNAPTVYNSMFNFVQFWDGRAATLADQAAGPPVNPVEMGCTSFDQIVESLKADPQLVAQFNDLYPQQGITEKTITDAIGEFEKTLITPDSRFDQYLKGNKTAINDNELKGYELFKANSCATCHSGMTLGGQSYELMGQRNDYFADRGSELIEDDHGRFKQTANERDKFRFKVPQLRNIALTAPYMHDGSAATLFDAVQTMAYYQQGNKLTEEQADNIVKFLNTLTGKFEGEELTNANTYSPQQ